jgi:hypothetical protein
MTRDRSNGKARVLRLGLIVASIIWFQPVVAQTEIHKCTDADGGVVYSQLPCTPQKTVETQTTEPEEDSQYPAPVFINEESAAEEAAEQEPELAADRASCKKRYRDAIDAIDAEIGREYTPEKAEHYKQRLLRLTNKLRQC